MLESLSLLPWTETNIYRNFTPVLSTTYICTILKVTGNQLTSGLKTKVARISYKRVHLQVYLSALLGLPCAQTVKNLPTAQETWDQCSVGGRAPGGGGLRLCLAWSPGIGSLQQPQAVLCCCSLPPPLLSSSHSKIHTTSGIRLLYKEGSQTFTRQRAHTPSWPDYGHM